jgi:hypothetical protein
VVADDEEVDADAAAVPPSSFFALAIDAKPRAQLAERADSWLLELEFEAVDVSRRSITIEEHESKKYSLALAFLLPHSSLLTSASGVKSHLRLCVEVWKSMV